MITRHSSITFDLNSPPAHVYEYRMDTQGNISPKKKKDNNMDIIKNDYIDAQMAEAADLPVVDTLDATLAVKTDENGEPIFTQDAEDINPQGLIEAQ